MNITYRREGFINIALLEKEGIIVAHYHPIQMRRHFEVPMTKLYMRIIAHYIFIKIILL